MCADMHVCQPGGNDLSKTFMPVVRKLGEKLITAVSTHPELYYPVLKIYNVFTANHGS